MAKTKTYRTLFVDIGDNNYRFPYSRNDKPSGQQEGVWYDFFVDTINKASVVPVAA